MTNFDVGNPAYIEGAVLKMEHARKSLDKLLEEISQWWAGHPVKIYDEIQDDQTTIHLIMEVDPVPDLNDWHNRVTDIVHNYRVSLNKFSSALFFALNGGKSYYSGDFPIFKSLDDFLDKWDKRHPIMPPNIKQRFHNFQSFKTKRALLPLLSRMNNLDKHQQGFLFTVSPLSITFGEATWTVEGIDSIDNLVVSVDLEDEFFNVKKPKQIIGTTRLSRKIVDHEPSEELSRFMFTPIVRFDEEEIKLFDFLRAVDLEVAWAIAYISRRYDSAEKPPKHINFEIDA